MILLKSKKYRTDIEIKMEILQICTENTELIPSDYVRKIGLSHKALHIHIDFMTENKLIESWQEKRIAGNGRPRLKRQYLSHWRITSIGTRTLNLLRESLKLLYGEKVNVS